MNVVKQYLVKLKRGVFHRGEALALEGGISFGPGRDPKGSFYSRPKLAIYWYRPDSAVLMDDHGKTEGLIKGLVKKLGGMRLSA